MTDLEEAISRLTAWIRDYGDQKQKPFIDDLTAVLAANEALRAEVETTRNEVASVLMLMDGLAEQWGDEGVFRRCRDRLRALVSQFPVPGSE